MKTVKLLSIVFCIVLSSQITWAQEYKVSNKSVVTIFGTSSMHDWESEVKKVQGIGSFTLDGNNVKDISSLVVKFKVKSIESGKSKMNKLTYEALKEKSNPTIEFKITKINTITSGNVEAQGSLTLAGKTNSITVKGKISLDGENITIIGEQEIDMTAYDIVPPKAMLGTVKVGKTITLKYNLILTK